MTMTPDEAAVERMAQCMYEADMRAECGSEDGWVPWSRLVGIDPQQYEIEDYHRRAQAALAELLAAPPPAVLRAVLERLIAEQQEECERLRRTAPYFVPHIEARIDFLSDRLAELGREESEGGH